VRSHCRALAECDCALMGKARTQSQSMTRPTHTMPSEKCTAYAHAKMPK
jgi:hypothetical protein